MGKVKEISISVSLGNLRHFSVATDGFRITDKKKKRKKKRPRVQTVPKQEKRERKTSIERG